MNHLLVVCEGNICRSPMAQGLFSVALPEVDVRSAGLNALSGMPADETAVQLMRARKIDIAPHRALQITRELCAKAELILVMSTDQRRRLEDDYPFARGRTFRIGEFIKSDIPDPYRKPAWVFRESLELIDYGIGEWLQRIKTM